MVAWFLIWTGVGFLRKEKISIGLSSPRKGVKYLMQAAEIFGVLAFLGLWQKEMHHILPETWSLLEISGLLFAWIYFQRRKKTEVETFLSYATALSLSQLPLTALLGKALLIGLVSQASLWFLEGLEFRALFSPIPKPLQGLPFWWLQFFLIGLFLSGFLG